MYSVHLIIALRLQTWPTSAKDDENRTTTDLRMVRWVMGVSLLEHQRNEVISEEATVKPIAMVEGGEVIVRTCEKKR